MDYFFPDFDSTTRLVMLDELDKDIESGLFYAPASMTSLGLHTSKGLLKKSLKQSLRDKTEHHKSELNRINKEIEKLILFTKESVKEHGFKDFIFDEKGTVLNENKKNPKHSGYKVLLLMVEVYIRFNIPHPKKRLLA